MRPFPNVELIRTFVAIVEHGRFNRAADALGLTESAVSHRLRKLEEMLDVRLIERQRERAIPTRDGQRFHEKAADALRALREAVDEVSKTDRRKVSITTSRAFATHWLMPRYRDLLDNNLKLEMQILITGRLCDMPREEIDLAIRYGDGEWPGLEAVCLVEEECFPVAAPGVGQEWSKAGWPSPETRAGGRVIVNGLHPQEWEDWCMVSNRSSPSANRYTTLESFDLVLNATLSGAGLAMGRRPMVDEYLKRGELTAPFGTSGVSGKAYFAVWPEKRPLTSGARSVLHWLLSETRRDPTKTNPALNINQFYIGKDAERSLR